MYNFLILTDMREPLKGFNRLAVTHTVAVSRDETYSFRFQELGPEHLVADG
jgi:hypothetical protein